MARSCSSSFFIDPRSGLESELTLRLHKNRWRARVGNSLSGGGKVPTDRVVDGVDVLPILLGDSTFQRGRDLYYFQGTQLEGVRSGDWKLRISPFQGYGNPLNKGLEPELYNLKTDPFEQHNRAKEFPSIVSELKKKLKSFKVEGAEIRR